MAWASIAAAAAPALASILGGGKSEAEKQSDALHKVLMENAQSGALEQPGAQAGMAQLREMLGRQRKADEAEAVRLGAQGSEGAVAAGAQRGRTMTSSMLDVVGQGQRQQRASLSRALGSANRRAGRDRRQRAAMFSSLAGSAQGVGQAFQGGPKKKKQQSAS